MQEEYGSIFSAAYLPEGSETTIHITASYYRRYIICPPYLNSSVSHDIVWAILYALKDIYQLCLYL